MDSAFLDSKILFKIHLSECVSIVGIRTTKLGTKEVRAGSMFSTIRQTRALFQSFISWPTLHQNNMLIQSFVATPIEFPDDDYLASDDSKLWEDYRAVGFDISGQLECKAKNDCSD